MQNLENNAGFSHERSMRSILLLLLFASPATALQSEMSRPELCRASTQVVVADVTSTETLWAIGEQGGLETRVWFSTQRSVRGTSKETLELLLPGGELDGLTHWVEHTPDFEMDARYLLFLAPHADRGTEVLGGEQGAIRIAAKPGDRGEALSDALRTLGDCLVH